MSFARGLGRTLHHATNLRELEVYNATYFKASKGLSCVETSEEYWGHLLSGCSSLDTLKIRFEINHALLCGPKVELEEEIDTIWSLPPFENYSVWRKRYTGWYVEGGITLTCTRIGGSHEVNDDSESDTEGSEDGEIQM